MLKSTFLGGVLVIVALAVPEARPEMAAWVWNFSLVVSATPAPTQRTVNWIHDNAVIGGITGGALTATNSHPARS